MQKFATAAPVTAVVNIAAGRVQVIAADRADATVDVRPLNPGKGRDLKASQQTTVEFVDGVLRIGTAEAKNQLFGPSGQVEVTLQVPVGSSLEAKSGAVELRGVGRLGDVTFDGAYRQIKIDEAGAVRLKAIDGDVEIGRLAGPAKISTSRGAIHIGEAVRGKVELDTAMGDITIAAASGVSASLAAHTGHGRLSNALKNDGTVGLDIHANTAMGDITARSL
jgi:DUF4097 and DUF4098 domain-containing protein YvlB